MRIDDVDPASMTGDQRALYYIYTTGARVAPDSPFTLVDADGRRLGPPAIWIINPVFGKALQQIGSAVRFSARNAGPGPRDRDPARRSPPRQRLRAGRERARRRGRRPDRDRSGGAGRAEGAGRAVRGGGVRPAHDRAHPGRRHAGRRRVPRRGHRARRAGAARTDHDRGLLQHGGVAARDLRRPNRRHPRELDSIWDPSSTATSSGSRRATCSPRSPTRGTGGCRTASGWSRSADRCILVDTGFADPAVHERLTAKYGKTRWCTPVDALARVGRAGRAGRHHPADPQPLRPRRLRRRLPRRARLHPAARDRVLPRGGRPARSLRVPDQVVPGRSAAAAGGPPARRWSTGSPRSRRASSCGRPYDSQLHRRLAGRRGHQRGRRHLGVRRRQRLQLREPRRPARRRGPRADRDDHRQRGTWLDFTDGMLAGVGGDSRRILPFHEAAVWDRFPSATWDDGLHVAEVSLAGGHVSAASADRTGR